MNGLDPLASKYPSIAPYTFVNNNPVIYVDPDGKKFIFAIGACSDCSDKGYGESFIKILSELGVENLILSNSRGEMGSDASNGSFSELYEDQKFTTGQYSRTPFYQLNSYNVRGQVTGKETIENTSYRIKDYYNNIKNELKANPLEEGEQLNLAGVSAGSVTTAQTALALANDGIVVDNLILIGSPIAEGTDLYKALHNNPNIKNVIFKHLEDDPIKNYSSQTGVEQAKRNIQLLTQGDDGPHTSFSNKEEVREEIANELVNEDGVK